MVERWVLRGGCTIMVVKVKSEERKKKEWKKEKNRTAG